MMQGLLKKSNLARLTGFALFIEELALKHFDYGSITTYALVSIFVLSLYLNSERLRTLGTATFSKYLSENLQVVTRGFFFFLLLLLLYHFFSVLSTFTMNEIKETLFFYLPEMASQAFQKALIFIPFTLFFSILYSIRVEKSTNEDILDEELD